MPTEKDSNSNDATERPKTFHAPGFVEIYSNASQGAYTPWDIQITFGRLDNLDGEQAVGELVTVCFSPQHAKAVAKVIENAVRGYEEKFGEIKLSDVQQPKVSKAPSTKSKSSA